MNYTITVGMLRKLGYKVAVLHKRHYDNNGIKKPKGGKTVIIIDIPHNEHFEGVAVCCNSDNYNKKMGVRIALGRSGVVNHLSIV